MKRALGVRTLVLALVCYSSIASAQRVDATRARALRGCWATTVGTFRAATAIGIDSGLTNVPPQLRLDTIPGRGWDGAPRGRLLRAIPGRSGSRYRDGYFRTTASDSVVLEWTNGFVGLSIRARVRADSMRGVATAWTDYMGEQAAPVTLHRIGCADGAT